MGLVLKTCLSEFFGFSYFSKIMEVNLCNILGVEFLCHTDISEKRSTEVSILKLSSLFVDSYVITHIID